MKPITAGKSIALAGLALLIVAGLGFLLAAPSGKAQAAPLLQDVQADTCKNCHAPVYDLWSQSKHGTAKIDCLACHRLEAGEGTHPQLNYLNLPEAQTCDVCHASIKTEVMASQHGERGMGCAACHEPHSQQQKLIGENQSTCENCHRSQVELTHYSTHGVTGVTCFDCHMGAEVGHTFISQISNCQSCHSDLHQANSLVRGAFVTPAAPSGQTQEGDVAAPAPRGGVNLPTWLFFVLGIGVGGGAMWVLIERGLDVNDGNGKAARDQESSEAQNETKSDEQ